MANVSAVAVVLKAVTTGFVKSIKIAARSMTMFEKIVRKVARTMARTLVRGFRLAERAMRGVLRTMKRLLTSTKLLMVAMAGGAALAALTVSSIKFAAAFDAIEFAMGNLIGSTEKAKKLMEDLKQFTIITPFRFEEIATAAKQLIAFGTPLEKLMPTLRALGDIASSVNTDIKGLVQGFGKAMARTRLTVRELRPFLERGVPILPALAKVLGIGDTEVLGQVRLMRVQFSHLEQAIANMTKEGSKFSGMMQGLSKRTVGLFQSLADTFQTRFQLPFGAALIKFFKLNAVMATLIDLMQTRGEPIAKKMAKWMFDMAVSIGKAVVLMASLGEAILRMITGRAGLAKGFEALVSLVKGLGHTLAGAIMEGLTMFSPRLAAWLGIDKEMTGLVSQLGGLELKIFMDQMELMGGSVAKLARKMRTGFFGMDKDLERLLDKVLKFPKDAKTLYDALEELGAGPPLKVVEQRMRAFIDTTKEALGTAGLSRAQKMVRELTLMADAWRDDENVMALFGEGIKLALQQAIMDAETLVGKVKAVRVAAVSAVGAVGPGTIESARLRFSAQNPVFKLDQKIASNTGKTAIAAAKLVRGVDEAVVAIRDLAALGPGTVGGP